MSGTHLICLSLIQLKFEYTGSLHRHAQIKEKKDNIQKLETRICEI